MRKTPRKPRKSHAEEGLRAEYTFDYSESWPNRFGSRAAENSVEAGGNLSDMDSRQLPNAALRLAPEERAALAGELIQSLDTEVDPDAEAAWSAEIHARLARVDAGLAKTVPWSEARRRIHAAAGHMNRRMAAIS